MDINTELKKSYYRTVADIDAAHNVFLVQHIDNHQFFVMKTLEIYDIDVFNFIKNSAPHGIPLIYDLFEDNNRLTIIEEHINGETLEEKLDQNGSLSVEAALNCIISLCDILKPLHAHIPPIVHRDIKPSNIMITPDNSIILLDLNTARIAAPGKESDTRLLGTRGYAAPEQYGFGSSGNTTDIYALGKLLEELLPPEYPDTINAIIRRCTRLEPEMRYPSVEVLKEELRKQLGIDTHHNTQCRFPFLPPGYREPTLFKSFIVTPLYLFTVYLCLGLTIKDASAGMIYLNRAIALMMALSMIFFSGNYMGIHGKLPLCRHHLMPIRILGILFFNLLILCIWMILLLILESLLFR